MAMVSRGYSGNHRSLDAARVTALDGVWLVGCALVIATSLGIDRALGR
jgi:hypothetical protein